LRAALPQRAIHKITSAHLRANKAWIKILSFERKDRCAGDNWKAAPAGKRGDNILRDAVGERFHIDVAVKPER
jgi:hypothetical protein